MRMVTKTKTAVSFKGLMALSEATTGRIDLGIFIELESKSRKMKHLDDAISSFLEQQMASVNIIATTDSELADSSSES